MRSYRFLHVDVFTDHLFGGNQLAVFPDGRGLSPATMQAIAKEINFSETTFVLPPEQTGTDVRVRIFTPGSELPMAGHPTIGTTFALARVGAIAPRCERLVFGLGAGPTPVTLTWNDCDVDFVWMTQSPPTFASALVDRGAAASALSLPHSAIVTTLPVQVVSCGLPYLMVPLETRTAVDAVVVNSQALDTLLHGAGASGVFVFSTEAGADPAAAYSRMFAPGLGVAEDPATGSASGPLGCYLVRHDLVSADQARSMISVQGVKMGRPSDVHISIAVDAGEISSVRVGGSSVLAGEGTMYIP